ncbi:hypothetical protein D3C78_1856290 [compost metagenome]
MAYTGAGNVAPAPVRLAAAKADTEAKEKVAATILATVVRISFIIPPNGIFKIDLGSFSSE